ncbi:MAG: hypothetical protein HY356_03860 [Gammaproteobacteria bacterium]|nr:hypothetical protein [Gammaproteobacteria bacterium]
MYGARRHALKRAGTRRESFLPASGMPNNPKLQPIEYLKRFGDNLHWVMTLEGDKKDLASIFELQWFFHDQAFLKLNTGIGLTREATDFAPELGVMFRF